MKRRIKQRRTIIVIVIFILIAAFIGSKAFFKDFRYLQSIFAPVSELSIYLVQKTNYWKENLNFRYQLIEDNIVLKEQIKEQQLLLQSFELLQEENKRLRQLLKIKKIPAYDYKVATIIGRSPDFWHKELVINLGRLDGIKEGSPVINQWGLVGKIKSAGFSTAIVQLITDSSSWVSCLSNRSRSIGLYKGENNENGKLHYLINQSDFQENDLLITSGIGEAFPKGLPVGMVTRVSKKGENDIPEVNVSLLANFDTLEEVIILVK